MLAELEIVPIGTPNTSLSPLLVDVAKLVDASGLAYRVGPMGTTVEGEWDEVMALARRCHQAMLHHADRVMTTIRIDDRTDQSAPGRLLRKVASLEAKVGKPLGR